MDDIAGRSRREQLRAALKTAASALANAGIGFALAGGYALWAHGAPEPDHDVDFLVAADDASAAAEALAEAGFAVEQPPENWLFKAHLGSVFVDILHTVNGVAVTSELPWRGSPFLSTTRTPSSSRSMPRSNGTPKVTG